MLKRNLFEIKKEMGNRGIKEINKKDILQWALIFAIEDLTEKIQKN